jgi:hypothetical protein
MRPLDATRHHPGVVRREASVHCGCDPPLSVHGGDEPRGGVRNGPESVWGDDELGARGRSVRCGATGLMQRLPTIG